MDEIGHFMVACVMVILKGANSTIYVTRKMNEMLQRFIHSRKDNIRSAPR